MNYDFRHNGSLAPLVTKMPWRRFKDKPISSLPDPYLAWLLARPHLDPALRCTARFVDAMRDGAQDQWEGH